MHRKQTCISIILYYNSLNEFFYSSYHSVLSFFWTAFSWTSDVTIDNKKYPTIRIMNRSHNLPISGLFSWKVDGWCKTYLWAFKVFSTNWANPSWTVPINLCNSAKVSFLNIVMTNNIWMWTLIIAFPMKVAEKNFLKGILKWPQVIPAKSNRGFGMDAQSKIVTNPYF